MKLAINHLLCAFILALGLIAGAFFVGQSLQKFKAKDYTVSVKGLSEMEVKSDLAVWQLTYKNSGQELSALEKKMSIDHDAILEFLKQQGFTDQEIRSSSMNVVDKMAREWNEEKSASANRFLLESSITVRTQNVDLVKDCLAKLTELLRKGIVVTGDASFHYTKFLELKPKMLNEAAQNAQQSAEILIASSGMKLEKVREAKQGSFIIQGKDRYNDEQDYNAEKSIQKKIRVVVSFIYNLQ
jgi:hypothetical protein